LTAITPANVRLGTWTILAESSETVQAIVTREREVYTVRDARGRVLGRYPTARQALASIAA
jgi:hypothetical protein